MDGWMDGWESEVMMEGGHYPCPCGIDGFSVWRIAVTMGKVFDRATAAAAVGKCS
jgi:hypothetical protein